jgi:hypothetical protein
MVKPKRAERTKMENITGLFGFLGLYAIILIGVLFSIVNAHESSLPLCHRFQENPA